MKENAHGETLGTSAIHSTYMIKVIAEGRMPGVNKVIKYRQASASLSRTA